MWNTIQLGARRPDIGASGLYIESIAAQVPTRAKRPHWNGAASRSGWLLAVPHVVGEWHCESRFAELPP